MMMEEARSSNRVVIKCRIAIVGAQSERVARVVELLLAESNEIAASSVVNNALSLSQSPVVVVVEYLPCVAKFGHYTNQSGQRVRYLASLEYHGPDGKRVTGSSLAPFWDDVAVDDDEHEVVVLTTDSADKDKSNTRQDFQRNEKATKIQTRLPGIAGVAIGCGIEKDCDVQDITRFFETLATTTVKASSQTQQRIDVLIDHVKPNSEFSTMKEEMEAYKLLDANGKAEATRHGTMGPGKMANFVRDLASRVLDNVMETEVTEAGEASVSNNAVETPVEITSYSNDATLASDVTSTEQLPDEPQFTLPNVDPTITRYACRICRSILLGEVDLEYPPHVPQLHSFASRKSGVSSSSSSAACQSLFLADGLEWMGDMSESQGKMHCPICSAKLGTWNWSGAQCSCGTWVTPAIQIPISKVDAILPQQSHTTATAADLHVTAPSPIAL